MAEQLLSVGLDVGTTTTQLIVSRLLVENRGSAFSVPEMVIADRQIQYRSPVHFTPLLGKDRVDGEKIRQLVAQEYQNAGISRDMVDTGAVIITGETSRKENAAAVLEAISGFAGEFVVATAGPDLESVLAAKGAGAVEFSEQTGKRVLHMDIGGGTSNLALIEDGKIRRTGCLNVGGRLIKVDENGTVLYVSPVLEGLCSLKTGAQVSREQVDQIGCMLTEALEMAAGLRSVTPLMDKLWTKECGDPWEPAPEGCVISFSGGVADCIEKRQQWNAFGDIGPVLGEKIRQSRLCRGQYRLGTQTIRATVIGAGCHSVQLSGSTVFCQNIVFPLKNLPVVDQISQLRQLDGPGVLMLSGVPTHYDEICRLAEEMAAQWPRQPVLIAMEEDCAKALGYALVLRLGRERPILCIDRVRLRSGDYLDVAAPVGSAMPVVVKTLIMNR